MPLLAEYALTPDVFDEKSYTSNEIAVSQLNLLREALFTEGIIRDLRNGDWKELFVGNDRTWHRRGKELLKKAATQGRIRKYPASLPEQPISDSDWCREALTSHEDCELEGVVVSNTIFNDYAHSPLVASISNLPSSSWWANRGGSIRIKRTMVDYASKLDLIFQCANHIMFIDANLDPSSRNYDDFKELIGKLVGHGRAPLIQIHRVISDGRGRHASILSSEEWEIRFKAELLPIIPKGTIIEVFLWDDFHDRYLISNIIGISLPYGFDTSKKENDKTTWTRLDRKDRDDVMREFDPVSSWHRLQGQFSIKN